MSRQGPGLAGCRRPHGWSAPTPCLASADPSAGTDGAGPMPGPRAACQRELRHSRWRIARPQEKKHGEQPRAARRPKPPMGGPTTARISLTFLVDSWKPSGHVGKMSKRGFPCAWNVPQDLRTHFDMQLATPHENVPAESTPAPLNLDPLERAGNIMSNAPKARGKCPPRSTGQAAGQKQQQYSNNA